MLICVQSTNYDFWTDNYCKNECFPSYLLSLAQLCTMSSFTNAHSPVTWKIISRKTKWLIRLDWLSCHAWSNPHRNSSHQFYFTLSPKSDLISHFLVHEKKERGILLDDLYRVDLGRLILCHKYLIYCLCALHVFALKMTTMCSDSDDHFFCQKLKVKLKHKQFESNRKPSGVRERDSNHLGWLANSGSDAHY